MPVDVSDTQDPGAQQGDEALLRPLFDVAAAWPGGGPRRVGLAVSGGSDSMALMHLAARVAGDLGWQLQVATVDHRLRPEAAAEAAMVGHICAGLGLPHEVLVWGDHPETGNVMQAASAARYRLLANWAKGQGITHVVTAHTADDQAETFLIGLSRRAGLDGLTGMRSEWTQSGVTFLRPYLRCSRAALRAFLTRHGHAWVDDPSNDSDRYTRARARKVLAALAPLGITAEGLSDSMGHLAATQRVMARLLGDTFARIGTEIGGSLCLDAAGFDSLDQELRRRLLVAALRWMTNTRHAPRADAIDRLQLRLLGGQAATLGGCAFRVVQGVIRISREARTLGPAAATRALWDGRWQIHGPHVPGQEIRALGNAGLAQIDDWRDAAKAAGLWREALIVTPAIWQGDRLVAAPVLAQLAAPQGRNDAQWRAELPQPFGMFIISH